VIDEVRPFSFLDLSLETGNLATSISNNFSAGSRSWDLNLADCLRTQRLQHRGNAGFKVNVLSKMYNYNDCGEIQNGETPKNAQELGIVLIFLLTCF
jgi:hypothetical protein